MISLSLTKTLLPLFIMHFTWFKSLVFLTLTFNKPEDTSFLRFGTWGLVQSIKCSNSHFNHHFLSIFLICVYVYVCVCVFHFSAFNQGLHFITIPFILNHILHACISPPIIFTPWSKTSWFIACLFFFFFLSKNKYYILIEYQRY